MTTFPKQKPILFILLAFTVAITFALPCIIFPESAHAQECSSGLVPCGRNCNNPNTAVDETKPCTLCHLIIGFWNLINYGFRIMVFVALVALVAAGIFYTTSGGSEQMITTAKTFLKDILMGFGIILLAWVIIFSTMRYLLVKPSLGIEKAGGWTKFECSTDSTTVFNLPTNGGDTPSPLKYVCNTVDVNGNGTIDTGEGNCNTDPGGTMDYNQCMSSCQGVAPSTRCGANNAGLCTAGLSCPALTREIPGNCDASQKCCEPISTTTLTASSTSLTFASTNAGSSSAAQTVTLTNGGTSSVTISNVSLTGNAFSRPAGAAGGTCANNQTLASNATCTISVVFSPTASGAYSGTITVAAGGQNTTVNLTGTGTGGGNTTASISVSPTSIDFGTVAINTADLVTVTIRNTGTQDVTINTIRATSPFTWTYWGNSSDCIDGKTLAPNTTCVVGANFVPVDTSTASGTMTINYGSGQTTTVSLTGRGSSAGPIGGGQVDLQVVNFSSGGTCTPSTGIAGSVTIKNNGSEQAGNFNVGFYSSGWLMQSQSVSGLAAGAETTIPLSLSCRNMAVHEWYKAQAKIDIDNQISETDESNNASGQRDFQVL